VVEEKVEDQIAQRKETNRFVIVVEGKQTAVAHPKRGKEILCANYKAEKEKLRNGRGAVGVSGREKREGGSNAGYQKSGVHI